MYAFEAHDHKKNLHRRYEISVSRDLFGWTLVELAWGRAGAELTRKKIAVQDNDEAEKLVQAAIRKRLNSEGRIGVAYKAVPV